MKNISIRLDEAFVKEADRLAKIESVDKSTILREALEKGLEEVGLDIAIEMFVKEKVSTTEAANIANISVGEMMEELAKRGIKQDIKIDDLIGSLEKALKTIK